LNPIFVNVRERTLRKLRKLCTLHNLGYLQALCDVVQLHEEICFLKK